MNAIDRSAFYAKIDDLLEIPAGTVNGSTKLSEIAQWDSLAVISFIAMVDSDYGVSLPAKEIAGCVTFDNLAALIDGK